MCRSRTAIRLCDCGTRTKTKDSKNRGNKDAFLALFFCSACVAYINSQSLRRRRRPFPSASGSTMDFSERESSPELSSSAESSVEFVAEIPGPDYEEESSTIVLTDSEDGPPKPKRNSPSISRLLAEILCLLHSVSD